MNTNWTKDELLAYVLLYVANADFEESNIERDVIASKIDRITFNNIHQEFDEDNDYQSIQKILAGIEAHQYSKEDISTLLNDVKTLFYADEDFDIKEQSMLMFLKQKQNFSA